MDTLLPAIIGHLVGDYLLQNDWMATAKKRASIPCAIHCFLWTLSVCLFAGWWTWWVPPLLFALHFIQDRTGLVVWWMNTIGQSKFVTGPYAPWSVTVVDNVWHIVTLYAVARALT